TPRKQVDFTAATDIAQLPGAQSFQLRAKEWRTSMSAAAHAAGLLPIVCADTPLDALDCIRSELDIRNGRLLSNFALLKALGESPTPLELLIPNQALGWEMADVFRQARESLGDVRIRQALSARRLWLEARRGVRTLRSHLAGHRDLAR